MQDPQYRCAVSPDKGGRPPKRPRQPSPYTLAPLTFDQWRALGVVLPHDPIRWTPTKRYGRGWF